MSAAGADPAPGDLEPDVAALIPLVRRIVGARVANPVVAEDLVQETLTRVLAAAARIAPGMLEPYAIVTARNMVTSMWQQQDRQRRNQHRLVDLVSEASPQDDLEDRSDRDAVSEGLARLPERERETLLAHEVSGRDTRSLAAELGSTAGAVAAQLNRTRARLRVEYLLVLEQVDPPTDRCRPVLFALSLGDRRRQREVDAPRHLLECQVCARLSHPLLGRGQATSDEELIPIRGDADIVLARQGARKAAAQLDFTPTDLTIIATAVSEIARNIVRFAGAGEIAIEVVHKPFPGVRITARDAGPGIADLDLALADGYSTYHGLGLGLPGARRLMDDFAVDSEVGRGTTVTMTKWQRRGST